MNLFVAVFASGIFSLNIKKKIYQEIKYSRKFINFQDITEQAHGKLRKFSKNFPSIINNF